MSAVMNQPQVAESVRAAQIAEAVESTPIVGTEVTIKIGLTPGTVTLIGAPITVALTMLLGWIILTSTGLPLFPHEMFAGAIVNAVGGMLASVPLFLLMRKGAQAIAQAG